MPTPLSQYKFTAQPFDLGRFDTQRIGRESEWERLLALVEEARTSRSQITGVLLGTYGAGKSFLLWKLAESFRQSKKAKVICSAPVRLIEPEQKRDFIKNLVIRIFKRGFEIERDLIPAIEGIKHTDIDCSDHLRAYVKLVVALGAKKDTAARRVMTGARVMKREAEAAGFGEVLQIKTNDEAISLLQALQLVLAAAGVEVLVLPVDEVEYVEALPAGARVSVLDSLKHLWDQQVDLFAKGVKAARPLMLLSATPTFWHNATAQTGDVRRATGGVGVAPFIARIKKTDVIEMDPDLGAKEAKRLITNRMTEARGGNTREPLIPFTDDYVDYVYELSQGLPRTIIEICAVVLTEAARRDLKSVDRKVAKQILRELLISYEPAKSKAP